MKNLGIFGDSYAATVPSIDSFRNGWSRQLLDKDPEGTEIYAEQGSSLIFSYDLFVKHNHKFKQNIFVVTASDRLTLPVKCRHKKTGEEALLTHWNSLLQAEHDDKEYTSENNLIKKIIDYFVYINVNYEYNDLMQKTIIDQILTVRPDTIVIPAYFMTDRTRHYCPGYKWSLAYIDANERARFKWDPFNDPRANHLSKQSNLWVLNHVEERLRGKFIDWNPSLTPQFTSFVELKHSS